MKIMRKIYRIIPKIEEMQTFLQEKFNCEDEK